MAKKIKICKEEGCNNTQTTRGFCRLHYLKNWKKLKTKKQKKAASRLNKYIESIVEKHPDRYMEVIKKEIRNPKFGRIAGEDQRSELDDVYRIFNDPGYEEDIDKMIRDLKVEDKF